MTLTIFLPSTSFCQIFEALYGFSTSPACLMLLNMSPSWTGLFCALWTPTNQDGRLIESALAHNLAFLKRHGVNGLLALGSTGEFLRLEPRSGGRSRKSVARLCSPLRLMINISELRPTEVAEMGRFARGIGAEAVSLLPPYFYPLAQDDLVEFFVRAAEAAQLPLFLYNFPERTGNRIASGDHAAVAQRVPVAGVKAERQRVCLSRAARGARAQERFCRLDRRRYAAARSGRAWESTVVLAA